MQRLMALRKKIFAIIALISLTINIFQPAIVVAQELPSPSPIESPTPAPSPSELPIASVEPSSAPIESITPTPSPSINPSPSVEPSPSLEPSIVPSASPIESPVPTSSPDSISSPNPESSSSPAPTSSPEVVTSPSPKPNNSYIPTVTPTPITGELQAVIVEQTAATSIEEFDLSINEEGSATLATDKLDYAPTDTALITGAGFEPGDSYSLTISSTDDPATSTTVSVIADNDGKIFYAYQLDGIYRPNYKVEAKDSIGRLVATITFTDSNPTIRICHANDSQSNPYIENHPDKSGDVGGHNGHNGGVWYPGIADHSWGDIIPPFWYGFFQYYPGKNWPAGETIYDNGCQPKADLIATKTNNVLGSTTLGNNFTWTITVTNQGVKTAEFNNEDIFQDNLPNTSISYSPTSNIPVTLGGGTTGDIDCDISSSNLICYDNSGDSKVKIPAGGWFSVTFTAIPTVARVYTNPRPGTGNICKADPDGKISESNDNNNSCSDSVTVTTPIETYLTVTKAESPDSGKSFNFALGLTPVVNFSLEDGESFTAHDLVAGSSLNVSETVDSAYITTVVCNGNGPYTQNGFLLTLRSGENTCTFTNTLKTGTVTAHKFGDSDLDGVQDPAPAPREPGEASLSGWTMNLYSGSGCNGSAIASGVTNSSGDYDFTGLSYGDYSISEVLQSGDGARVWTNITPLCQNVTLDSSAETLNFGNFYQNFLNVCKVNDVNGDGDYNGESWMNGWEITLTGPDYSRTQTTGDSQQGCTRFTNLFPGTYTATEIPQLGWTQTTSAGNPNTYTFEPGVQGAGASLFLTNTQSSFISGIKFEDQDGEVSTTDDRDPLSGWSISLYKWMDEAWSHQEGTATDESGAYSFDNLLPGLYQVREEERLGWDNLTPLTLNVTLGAGSSSKFNNFVNTTENSDKVTLCHATASDSNPFNRITVSSSAAYHAHLGDQTSHQWGEDIIPPFIYKDIEYSQNWDTLGQATFHNNCDSNVPGSISIHKVIDADRDLNTTEDQTPGENWEFTLGKNSLHTNQDGYVSFDELTPGSYDVTEIKQEGYDLISATCGLENGSLDGNTLYSVNVEINAETKCTFYNSPNGKITGYKWNDENGDSEKNEGESLLAGWTIELYQYKHQGEDRRSSEYSLIKTMITDSSIDKLGYYWFDHLFPGDYKVCEVPQSNWRQTYPKNLSCHFVTLPTKDQTYNFGNQAKPVITLQKTNNATGNKNPNDIVTYTLKLTLSGSDLDSITVTDVTPEGFDYIPGSWTSTLAGVSEPNYASPGVWELDSLHAGDEVTLTYQVKIKDGLDGGTYHDLAWASGDNSAWSNVLAQGVDSSYVDENFVGTSVTINQDLTQSGNAKLERETGNVLGASTELPATGADTIWLFLALGSLLAGLTLIFGDKKMKKSLLILVVFLSLSHFVTTQAMAADPENQLSIRLEQPLSPTRDNDWRLSFSVLDRALRTPAVTCFVKKPNSGSYVQFGNTYNSTKSQGDNGSCQVNSDVMNEQGEYQFYALAVAEEDTEESNHVIVKYDTSGPGTPNYYSKEHPSSCKYVIKFHTADDAGATTKVEIYSSDQKTFDTNNGSRVGTVNLGSNQDGTFTHDRADNCDREWYYVIRAFDAAGNYSDVRGDEFVIVSTSTTTSSPVGAALLLAQPNAGTVLGSNNASSDSSDTGEVLGEEMSPSPEATIISASSLPATVVQNVKSHWLWYLLGGVVIIFSLYAYLRSKKS